MTALPADGGSAPRWTILSVEDDLLVAMGTSGTLEELGHAVIEASSGARALEILRERPDIDILMTDQGMPGMSGIELAKAARQLRPDMPIILVTGYLQPPDDGGLNLFVLQKPFRSDGLAAALAEAGAQPRTPSGQLAGASPN